MFWGTEHFLKQIEGVEATQVGYANGNIANPTYQQVCTGTTDFAETVKYSMIPMRWTYLSLSTFISKRLTLPASISKGG